MTKLSDRLAVYSMNDDEEVPQAVRLILDVLDQAHATAEYLGKAVGALDALDTLRAAEVAALTARVAALEAAYSVKV